MLLKKKKMRNIQGIRKYMKLRGGVAVEGPDLEFFAYTHPIKTRKVNIGMNENTKFVHIGD